MSGSNAARPSAVGLKPSDQLDQSPMSESVLENVQLDCKRGSRDILRIEC